MGERLLCTRKQGSGTAALSAAGLLGMALRCLPLASTAAGRFGLNARDGIVAIAAGAVECTT